MRTMLALLATLMLLSGLAQADPLELRRIVPKDLELRAARVHRSFWMFHDARTVDEQANRLELLRARDRLQLFYQPSQDAGGLGAALMAAMCGMVAHAPKKVRAVFDGPVHLGPALFDSGGMGVGLGGRWM